MMKPKRAPKVKVDPIDLESFLYGQLEVDPYWDDLYNPPQPIRKKNKKRSE